MRYAFCVINYKFSLVCCIKKRDNPFLGIGYKGEEYFCDRTKETEAAKKKTYHFSIKNKSNFENYSPNLSITC